MDKSTEVTQSGSSKHVKVELSAADKRKKDECTLFVGNLPMSLLKRQFEAPFKQFGKILSSRFRSAPVKEKYKKQNKKFGVMKKDFLDGGDKLSQNGYIVFADKSSVQAAVESQSISGSDLFKSGHKVRLDYVVKPEVESAASGAVRKFDRKKSIYVPHLPASVTDVDVTTAVESVDATLAGSVKGVRIVRSEKSGTFAFVLLSERAHATKLIKLSAQDGVSYTFGIQKMFLKFERILKEDELALERRKKLTEVQESAKVAAKKSLSRVKWQARLTRQGNPKVVSHHAMPRQDRQEKMSGAARRLFNKNAPKRPARQ